MLDHSALSYNQCESALSYVTVISHRKEVKHVN